MALLKLPKIFKYFYPFHFQELINKKILNNCFLRAIFGEHCLTYSLTTTRYLVVYAISLHRFLLVME